MNNGSLPETRYRYVIAICALIVLIAGVVTLCGWFSGELLLSGRIHDWVPMPSSNALLFILFGGSLLVRVFLPQRREAHLISTLAVSLCGVGALLLLILSLKGIHPEFEHPGITISDIPNTPPIGHMSPVSAFSFIISSFSFFLTNTLSSTDRRRITGSHWLASLLIVTNFVFLLAYIYGTPFLYGGSFIPPSVPTTIAFLFLGTSLYAYAAATTSTGAPLNGSTRSATRLLILVFTILCGGILITGFLYFRQLEEEQRLDAEKGLSAIADLKVNELVLWRKERLGDAAVIKDNPAFAALVKRYFSDPRDMESKIELKSWMENIQNAYQYARVLLLDTNNRIRLSSPMTRETPDSRLTGFATRALHSGKVQFLDLHRHKENGPIHLSLLIPLFDDKNGNRPLGTMVLWIDPNLYLYPAIMSWPVPNRSGETLIVRREGEMVVYLNALRFSHKPPLSIRFPLTNMNLPAAESVQGKVGIVEGRDYRGVPVVAALRHVPDSPWFLVAKMDADEIYGPLHERLRLVIGLVSALLAGSAAGIGLIWRQQSAAFYKDRFRIEREKRASEERYQELVQHANSAIVRWRRDGTITFFNEYAQTFFGYPGEEAIGMHVGTLVPVRESTGTDLSGLILDIVKNPESYRNSINENVCRDGRRVWMNWTNRPIFDENGLLVEILSIGSDISDLKRHEKELQKKNIELEQLNYTVSHDLKSPLVTIKTFLGYLVQDMAKGDKTRIEQDMTYIQIAAERMGRLLEELFELTRLGRKWNPPVDVSFKEVAQEAIKLVSGQIRQFGIEIKLDDSLNVMLHGDRPRLVQLWQNLVDNAAKFMGDQADPLIEVGFKHESKMGAVFFVRDNGRGIDPRHQEKIFGLFEQLDPGVEGTGIGLALVKRIVDLYGGRLWMESEGIGRGTSFFFTLPDALKSK